LSPTLRALPLSLIDAPPMPARVAMDDGKLQELMQSMKRDGQLQPIGVYQVGERFVISYGHRRFEAAKRIGWVELHALIFAEGEFAADAAKLAENIYREDLSAGEEALLFAEAQELYKLDEAGLCDRFHVSADYLADRLRLLSGDQRVFESVLKREINFSVARELNKCPDEEHRRYLLTVAETCGYPARVIADMVRQWRVSHAPQGPPTPPVEPAAEVNAPSPHRVCCILCGGDRDPYNLININIHRWEWERIENAIRDQDRAQVDNRGV